MGTLFSLLTEEDTESGWSSSSDSHNFWAAELGLRPRPFSCRSHALTHHSYGLSTYRLLKTDGSSHQNILQSNHVLYLPGFYLATSFLKSLCLISPFGQSWSKQVVPIIRPWDVRWSWYKAAAREQGTLHLQKAGGGIGEQMLSAPSASKLQFT